MKLICLLWLIAFSEPVDCQAQAEVLLSYAPHSYQSRRQAVAFDNEENLWVATTYDGNIVVSRINSKGNPLLDKVLVRKWNTQSPADLALYVAHNIVCDRWNNAYLMTATAGAQDIHINRITPEGQVEDYFPWAKIDWEVDLYMELLPSDTLLVVGANVESQKPHGKRPVRLAKAYLDQDGLTLVSETDYDPHSTLSWFMSDPDFETFLPDWAHAKALCISIDPIPISQKRYGTGPDTLTLYNHDLAAPYDPSNRRKYYWRDYVWRSFPDTWIGEMTLAPYKNGGYTLFFPDPLDRSNTYAVRLNEDGELLDPDDLTGGGERSGKSFGNLPSQAEPHAYFYINGALLQLDSARVSFWGCDENGNLYNYTQLRKYPSEHPEN